MHPRFASLLLIWCAACAGSPEPAPPVEAVGSMRAVLREGRSEPRVQLTEATAPTTIGVGALSGLQGEVTILDGQTLVARGDRVTVAQPEDQATLLVTADVTRWQRIPLGDIADLDGLEAAIAATLTERGSDPTGPWPLRVRGEANHLALHVIAGACPIAHPDGPAPWRWTGSGTPVELIGFYAEGAHGRLTHHGRKTHLHAVTSGAAGRMGHLDEIALRDAELLLPSDDR